jgi:peptidyl-prolyl cis-trans isomerase SurA
VVLGMALQLPSAARAETLDRVVASIGPVAITQRDVEEEYHFEQFLAGRSPAGSPSPDARKAVLNRLISQKLLAEQIGNTIRESANAQKPAGKTLAQIRKEFPSDEAYRSALDALGMSEPQVLKRLEIYEETLRTIDERLRPSAWPDPKAVENYYKETFVPEYAKSHKTPPPPFAEVRSEIQEILVQKNMNQLLERWLDQLRSTSQVTIHSNSNSGK